MSGEEYPCGDCGGSGVKHYVDYSDPNNQQLKVETCPTCGGRGTLPAH